MPPLDGWTGLRGAECLAFSVSQREAQSRELTEFVTEKYTLMGSVLSEKHRWAGGGNRI